MRKRNYLPRGKDPKYEIYHSEVDRRMLLSNILNGANKPPSVYTVFDINDLKFQLLGDAEGVCKRDSSNWPVTLSENVIVKSKLIEIDKRFQRYCDDCAKQGKPLPKEMPKALFEEKLLAEAHQFIVLSEIEEIEKRLNLIKEREKVISDANVLKNGPIGSSQLRDGKLNKLDGMQVCEIKTDEGFILIIDEAHPKAKNFNGYSTADYLQYVVTPWKNACAKQAEINKAEAVKNKVKYELLTKGQKQGLNAPVPFFPDYCINYKQKVLERSKS